MTFRGRTRALTAVGALALFATAPLLLPTAATAAEPGEVFALTFAGPTPGVLLEAQEGAGELADGTSLSFVSWSVVNPTASPVTLTASRAGNSGIGTTVVIPAYTEGYSIPDEYWLRAGESVTLSVAGVGTVTVDRVATGTDPLGDQSVGDAGARDVAVFVSGFTATPAAGGGTDVAFDYRRMAYQPVWLDDVGQFRAAAVDLRQYSGTEGSRELHADPSAASLVATSTVLGAGDGAGSGSIATHIDASPATVRTLSLVQSGAPAARATLAQGTFGAAAIIAPPVVDPPTTTSPGGAVAGRGSASVALPAALAASGPNDVASAAGSLLGGSVIALGLALVIIARRKARA